MSNLGCHTQALMHPRYVPLQLEVRIVSVAVRRPWLQGSRYMICRKKNGEFSKDFIGNLDTEVPFFSMDMFPWEQGKAPCPWEPSRNLLASLSPCLNYCLFLLLFQGSASSWENRFHKRGTERHDAVTEALEKSFVGESKFLSVLSDRQEKRYPRWSICPAKMRDWQNPVASHTSAGSHACSFTNSLKETVNRNPCLRGNSFPL